MSQLSEEGGKLFTWQSSRSISVERTPSSSRVVTNKQLSTAYIPSPNSVDSLCIYAKLDIL